MVPKLSRLENIVRQRQRYKRGRFLRRAFNIVASTTFFGMLFIHYGPHNPKNVALIPRTAELTHKSLLSPDGKHFAFSTDELDGNQELYITDGSLEHVQRLTNTLAKESFICWSPKNSSILFKRDDASTSSLMMHNLDTQQIITIFSGATAEEGYSSNGYTVRFLQPSSRKAFTYTIRDTTLKEKDILHYDSWDPSFQRYFTIDDVMKTIVLHDETTSNTVDHTEKGTIQHGFWDSQGLRYQIHENNGIMFRRYHPEIKSTEELCVLPEEPGKEIKIHPLRNGPILIEKKTSSGTELYETTMQGLNKLLSLKKCRVKSRYSPSESHLALSSVPMEEVLSRENAEKMDIWFYDGHTLENITNDNHHGMDYLLQWISDDQFAFLSDRDASMLYTPDMYLYSIKTNYRKKMVEVSATIENEFLWMALNISPLALIFGVSAFSSWRERKERSRLPYNE